MNERFASGPAGACARTLLLLSVTAAGACGGEAPIDVGVVQAGLVSGVGNCPTFPNNAVCACNENQALGNCTIFTHDVRFYMNLSLAPFQAWNDTITSVVVGPDAKAKFCQNPGGAGTCKLASGDGINAKLILIPQTWSGMDNSITSIRVDNRTDDCQNPAPGQLAIFEDPNFNAGAPTRDCVLLDGGYYANPFLNASDGHSGGGFGLNDNVITSVKVTELDLYVLRDSTNFNGSWYSNNLSVANLGTVSFDDKTTSIQVFCAHNLCASGSALMSSCDSCVAAICAPGVDPFCCSNSWDSICEGEVSSVCGRSPC